MTSPALPALAPDEYSWISKALRRYIDHEAQRFREVTDSEEFIEALHDFSTTVVAADGLLIRRVIRPQDRVPLMLFLRYERRCLRDQEGDTDPGHAAEAHAELEFIDSFLKRLSQVDWEAFGPPQEPYDPTKYWGSFRLTETEMATVFSTCGNYATYSKPFGTLAPDAIVALIGESGKDESGSTLTIRITRLRASTNRWATDEPSGMMFEGEVVSGAFDSVTDGTGEVFGFMFPNGNAIVIENSPDSDLTDRYIRAGLAIAAVEA